MAVAEKGLFRFPSGHSPLVPLRVFQCVLFLAPTSRPWHRLCDPVSQRLPFLSKLVTLGKLLNLSEPPFPCL